MSSGNKILTGSARDEQSIRRMCRLSWGSRQRKVSERSTRPLLMDCAGKMICHSFNGFMLMASTLPFHMDIFIIVALLLPLLASPIISGSRSCRSFATFLLFIDKMEAWAFRLRRWWVGTLADQMDQSHGVSLDGGVVDGINRCDGGGGGQRLNISIHAKSIYPPNGLRKTFRKNVRPNGSPLFPRTHSHLTVPLQSL